MERFNFAAVLFSIVVGLGIADIGNSLHRLLTAEVKVRWSALPLATAAYVTLMLVMIWYDLWTLRNLQTTLSFWFLLPLDLVTRGGSERDEISGTWLFLCW